MPLEHVVVAMSGGVDSSVAALLLVRQGLQVTGVTMDIWCPRDDAGGVRSGGCCGADVAPDAAGVCAQLGIEHYIVNFRQLFEEQVIAPFVAAYAAGRTPNPCLDCNRAIKWDALLKWAQQLGADAIATGHYARILDSPTGSLLARGTDREKDQSYALYMLTPEELRRTRLPVGEQTKSDSRRMAREANLPVADREESQEICFIPEDDYRQLIRERAPEALQPGPILDRKGNVLGEHHGAAGYTVGQRRGLGLPEGPWYVVAIDPKRNAVVVGPEEEALVWEITVADVHLGAACTKDEFEATVMTRYRGPERSATVTMLPDGRANVRFSEPQRAPAPGQAAVFYQGETVLGGGTICKVEG